MSFLNRFVKGCVSLGLVGISLLILGCGSGGPPPKKDDSRNPLSHAKYIKNLAIRTLEKVPNAPKDVAIGLLENMRSGLAQYENVSLGEFEGTYRELVQGTNDLFELCRQGADKAQIKARADALIEKANTLPGELEPEPPG